MLLCAKGQVAHNFDGVLVGLHQPEAVQCRSINMFVRVLELENPHFLRGVHAG